MKQAQTTRGMKTMAAVGLGVILLGGQPAVARENIRQDLSGVADPNASGQVRLILKTASSGQFEVRARGLDPRGTFDVIVSGVKVGTLTTSGGGSGRARFRTRPHGRHDFLLGFDPRGAAVVVRNAAGEDVLGGTVPAGASSDPTKLACCVPDDDGSECEDRTAAECAAEGGAVSAAATCLPNPCSDASPNPVDTVCCLPDDSGAECEDRTASECAAEGGIVVEATGCLPNPCAATPSTNPDIRCCLPDDGGTECEDRTAEQCAAEGGVDLGPGSCTPNPCANASAGGSAIGSNGAVNDDNGRTSGGGKHGDDTGSPGPAGDSHGGRTTYY
jgi:hypothetical protein